MDDILYTKFVSYANHLSSFFGKFCLCNFINIVIGCFLCNAFLLSNLYIKLVKKGQQIICIRKTSFSWKLRWYKCTWLFILFCIEKVKSWQRCMQQIARWSSLYHKRKVIFHALGQNYRTFLVIGASTRLEARKVLYVSDRRF